MVNETGKKLKKAFHWKADGMKNEETIARLKAMGVKMYKQQLTKIFKKPFYCGLINHGLLDGKVKKGKHEAMISPELFMRINEIHQQSGNYGVPHLKERVELPLKVFVKCECCGMPLTEYVRVKETSIKTHHFYYYKCRTKGCGVNKRAELLHDVFLAELEQYTPKEEHISAIQFELETYYEDITEGNPELEATLNQQLKEVERKLENIEEKYFAMGEMNKETFEKYRDRFLNEKSKILTQLQDLDYSISNLSESIAEVMSLSLKLATVWTSGGITMKEDFQKPVFPQGIFYNLKNGSFRTPEVNFIFRLIACQQRVSGENEKGTNHLFDDLSPSAEREGFEPPEVLPSTVFKTAAIDHSAISPAQM